MVEKPWDNPQMYKDFTRRFIDLMFNEGLIDQKLYDFAMTALKNAGAFVSFQCFCGKLESGKIQIPEEFLDEFKLYGMELDADTTEWMLELQEAAQKHKQ